MTGENRPDYLTEDGMFKFEYTTKESKIFDNRKFAVHIILTGIQQAEREIEKLSCEGFEYRLTTRSYPWDYGLWRYHVVWKGPRRRRKIDGKDYILDRMVPEVHSSDVREMIDKLCKRGYSVIVTAGEHHWYTTELPQGLTPALFNFYSIWKRKKSTSF